MIYILSEHSSILNQYIAEIRDQQIQQDRIRFRRNMERIGEIFAYEISKTLAYKTVTTQTVLGEAETKVLAEQPVVATILRAGLPLHNGLLNIFDTAQNAFISAYRRHHKDNSFDIHVEYLSTPLLDDKTLILCDPMLATGSSMVLSYKALLAKGTPKHTHIVSVIASKEGVDYFRKHMPGENYTLWLGAIDEELTAHAYIVPGLGDAGDLAYGEKL
ncbi:MAG TPA: uracil phosphoribosyltransferase [Bacteroidia bacterium]|jgi:uracil phosphoribosyltransferase|nr:uracil phosphoribosyltransferase [Bacteroidia bacterium]